MLKEKEKGKLISITQIILFVFAILYLLESIFIRGMFTNIFILLGVGVFAIIAAVIALFKKEYKLVGLDFIICIGCFIIFNILEKL